MNQSISNSATRNVQSFVPEAAPPKEQAHSTSNLTDTAKNYAGQSNPGEFSISKCGPQIKLPAVTNSSGSMTAGQVPSISPGDPAYTSKPSQLQLNPSEAPNAQEGHSNGVKDLLLKFRKTKTDSPIKAPIPHPPPPPPVHGAAKPATRCNESWSAKVS